MPGEEPIAGFPGEVDLSGTIFEGRFTIRRKIGEGSMGEVYEAEHLPLGRRVAVKVLKPERASREVFLKRFLREARAASMVKHPNVVDILDFGSVPDGPVYFVMEFVEGRDLAAILQQERRLPWARARLILLQLASAVGAVHEAGIIHRDIKPSNCLLQGAPGRERVKLTDFGVIKYESAQLESRELTNAEDVIGTVLYMSPEQCRGEPAHFLSDIYALGVMAYEMVTGQMPFPGKDIFQVMSAHLRTTPPRVRELVGSLPEEVEAIIMRAIAKEPKDRFESVRELEMALLAAPGPEGPALPFPEIEVGEDDLTLVRPESPPRQQTAETEAGSLDEDLTEPRSAEVRRTEVQRGLTVPVPVVVPAAPQAALAQPVVNAPQPEVVVPGFTQITPTVNEDRLPPAAARPPPRRPKAAGSHGTLSVVAVVLAALAAGAVVLVFAAWLGT